MRNLKYFRYVFFSVVLLGGCAAIEPVPDDPQFAPVYQPVPQPPQARGGSLFQDGYGISLFTDRPPFRPGDILTIRLEEQMRSSQSSATSVEKETTTALDKPTVLGKVFNSPFRTAVESETQFEGESETDQQNSLTGTITANVVEVLPNGLIAVQGEKWIRINRSKEYVRVAGLVRPEDVNGDNSVSSLRMANARLAYSGTGPMASANQEGWFTRFFTSAFMPF